MRALLIAAAVVVCNAAFAADATPRYRLSGSGALRQDASAQTGGGLHLKAVFEPKDAAIAAQPPVQENARFALMAAITASPSVCYDDTIFRDDFDGDGF
jgi:hypothetical protein